MVSLDVFGFRALWSPYFFAFTIIIAALYFYITFFRLRDKKQFKIKEAVFFSIGMVLLYLVKGSPIDLLGHLSFTVHMIQMAFLFLVIPPILLLGTPDWLLRKFVLRKTFIRLTHPLVSLIAFNGFFSIYHIPLVFDVVKTDMVIHAAYTSFLFGLSFLMWWHVVGKVAEAQRLSGLLKLGYIFGNGVLITPACALIIFANAPMYDAYSDPTVWAEAMKLCVPAGTLASLDLNGPEMFVSMPLLEDQQTGGVIMKIIQEIVYGIFLGTTFYTWFREGIKKGDEETEKYMELHSS